MNFIYAGDVLTIYLDKDYTVHKSNPNFRAVVAALKKGNQAEVLKALHGTVEIKVEAPTVTSKVLEMKGEKIYYNGELLENDVTERIQTYVREGLPYEPLFRFLENLLQNPSFHSRKQAFRFLSHKHLPITDDGCFLGYKSVRSDFKDWHSGKYSNRVGDNPTMDRGNVDDNHESDCGLGFHVGTVEYAMGFYNEKPRHLMIVKVNPKDIVSVPSSETNKMRVCSYLVVGEYTEHLSKPLYNVTTNGYPAGSNELQIANKYDVVEVKVTPLVVKEELKTSEILKKASVKMDKAVSISDETRKKLSDAAKRLKRGPGGKFLKKKKK